MYQLLLTAGVGFAVGILVGLTGVGGGALLVPILVVVMRVPPIIAVGTGAVFVAGTKLGAAWSYYRRGHVELPLVGRMALGSIPGAILGVGGLALLRAHIGDGVNNVLKILIGSLLVATPVISLVKKYLERSGKKSLRDRLPPYITANNGAVIVGFVGGCLVGMTSMGSGSIIMSLLLLFYSRSVPTLVGTDIAHAVILGCVAGAGHLLLGTVDFRLLLALLIGSIPGAWFAAHMATSVRTVWLRRVLYSILVVAGLSMF